MYYWHWQKKKISWSSQSLLYSQKCLIWSMLFCSTLCLGWACISSVICVKLCCSVWVAEENGCVREFFSQANLRGSHNIIHIRKNIFILSPMTCFFRAISPDMYSHCEYTCHWRVLGRQNCGKMFSESCLEKLELIKHHYRIWSPLQELTVSVVDILGALWDFAYSL